MHTALDAWQGKALLAARAQLVHAMLDARQSGALLKARCTPTCAPPSIGYRDLRLSSAFLYAFAWRMPSTSVESATFDCSSSFETC